MCESAPDSSSSRERERVDVSPSRDGVSTRGVSDALRAVLARSVRARRRGCDARLDDDSRAARRGACRACASFRRAGRRARWRRADSLLACFIRQSGVFVDADAELEALAARRDAAKAAAEAAQKAYVRALAASVSPSADSKSMDEATERFNASPFADCACEYGFIQSNAGLYIDLSKNRPPGVPKNVLAIATENFATTFR